MISRRSFFGRLFAGLAVLPSAVKAFAHPTKKSLRDWIIETPPRPTEITEEDFNALLQQIYERTPSRQNHPAFKTEPKPGRLIRPNNFRRGRNGA